MKESFSLSLFVYASALVGNRFGTLLLPTSSLTQIYLVSTGMNATAFNNMLVYLNSLTFTNSVILSTSGYGAPSGAGATAKAALISKGWTVTTD